MNLDNVAFELSNYKSPNFDNEIQLLSEDRAVSSMKKSQEKEPNIINVKKSINR